MQHPSVKAHCMTSTTHHALSLQKLPRKSKSALRVPVEQLRSLQRTQSQMSSVCNMKAEHLFIKHKYTQLPNTILPNATTILGTARHHIHQCTGVYITVTERAH